MSWVSIKAKLSNWAFQLSPLRFIGWINKNLSSDPSSSNSRVLQTIIVLSIVPLVWLVVSHSDWKIEDNPRLILLALITAGAGSYITNRVTSRGYNEPPSPPPE